MVKNGGGGGGVEGYSALYSQLNFEIPTSEIQGWSEEQSLFPCSQHLLNSFSKKVSVE